MTENKENKRIWEFPWQFAESFIILSTAIILSFILDFFANSNSEIKLMYPTNIYILVSFIIITAALFIFFKNSKIFQWLSSGKLAITSIIWLLILVILMGIISQNKVSNNNLINSLGLNNIINSKAFYIVQFFLLINLLTVTISKLNSFSIRNISFIINHLGIFILIVSLSFGAGDIEQYTIKLDKKNYVWQVKNTTSQTELPFALKLKDFDIEMFPAKIAIVDNKSDEILKGNNRIISANKDSSMFFNDYEIRLLEYLPNAVFVGEKYHFVNDQGAAPAAKLNITDKSGGRTYWISCGSFMYPSQFFAIDSNYTLAMLEPEPKLFQSKIELTHKNSETENITISVNQPVNILGWDIYQTDYNKEMGKWSEYSVIEIVKDPWLNFVYLGIFMMMFGSIALIFLGRKK